MTAKKVSRVYRWWLEIVDGDEEESTLYLVERVGPGAWRLTKGDGENYVVSAGEYGGSCECPDWYARRERAGEFCKHLTALGVVGLVNDVVSVRKA